MISHTTTLRPNGFAAPVVGGTGAKRRALVEFGLGYGLILCAIWTPSPWRDVLSFATLGWIALANWGSFPGWDAVGVRREGFSGSLWVVGATLGAAGAAVLVADRVHTLHAPHSSWLLVEGFWGYTLWSFLQQFLLQDFFLRRLRLVLPGTGLAVFVAASLFAVAHLPNPVLTVLTLVWGVLSCVIFLRYRNLFTVGIVHAILGICVAVTVPVPMQHGMRVGLGYWDYGVDVEDPAPIGEIVPVDMER